MMSITGKFREAKSSQSILHEIQALCELRKALFSKTSAPSDIDWDPLEEDYLHQVRETPKSQASDVFSDQSTLDEFVCYMFMRRYGWSEVNSNGMKGNTGIINPTHKSQINEITAGFLKWFEQGKPDAPILLSFIHTIKQAHNKPVVRSQTVVHLMEWLKRIGPCLQDDTFITAKEAMLLGVCDVWSPIRSGCVARLSHIIPDLTVSQMNQLFSQLISVCGDSESTWQAREGAVMAISVMVRRFQWTETISDFFSPRISEGEISTKPEFILKFGTTEFCAMPEFISKPLKEVIFSLLCDDQLSIREHAIKCYAAYLGRCELQEAVETFEKVITKLNPCGSSPLDGKEFLQKFTFLRDYEAEGLLGVCVHLVKQIPSEHLQPLWPCCFPLFSLYLGHQASTVRQVTSTIFKFVVAKDSSNPAALRLILHGLSSPWKPDMEYLTQPQEPVRGGGNDSSNTQQGAAVSSGYYGAQTRISLRKWLAQINRDETSLSQVWEWREGRLFAYELILQFLIKNHWLYTFGAAHLVTLTQDGPEAQDLPGPLQAGDSAHSSVLHQSLRGSGLSAHSKAARDEYGRRGSCLEDIDNVHGRPHLRRSSESGGVDIPFSVHHHRRHHHRSTQHHRLTSLSQTSSSVGSGGDEKFGGRTPTVGCGSSSVRLHGRHYSYYTKSPVQTEGTPSGYQSSTAASLLSLSLNAELTPQELEGVTLPMLSDPKGTSKEADTESLSVLLVSVLYQCLESLADVRWELRRMGQQLLPSIVEVIRWYNMPTIEEFLDNYLLSTTSVTSYGACASLLYSLSHAAKLSWLLQEPPTSWQDVHLCRRTIQAITRSLRKRVVDWIRPVHRLLLRPVYDRLTTVSMETAMIAIGNFGIEPNEKAALTKDVIATLINVYKYTHPESDLLGKLYSISPQQMSALVPTAADHKVDIACDGIFSCKVDTVHSRSTSIQLEKYLLMEVKLSMKSFLQGAALSESSLLLPLLTAWLAEYIDDDTLVKPLVDSISLLCNLIGVHTENNEEADCQVIQSYAALALKRLCCLISMKSLDLQTLKQMLDLSLIFLKTGQQNVVQELLQTVAVYIQQIGDWKPVATLHQSEQKDEGQDHYRSLSSDVSVLSLHQADDSVYEDEIQLEPAAEGPMPETQLLNASGNSGHSGGALRARSHTESESDQRSEAASGDESSDWDDWEDEEHEDHSAVEAAFKEYVESLRCRLVDSHHGNRASVLESTIRQLPETDQRIISRLLHKP